MVIGYKEKQKDGSYKYIRQEYEQGFVYKDFDAFKNKSDDVCYVPEMFDYQYTYKDILYECLGNEKLSEEVFNTIDWQTPFAYINDLMLNGNVIKENGCFYFNPHGDFEEWEPSDKYL